MATLLQGKYIFGASGDTSGFSNSAPRTPGNLSQIVCIVIRLALDFVPYLVVIALGAFLQGLIKYVGHGDNEEKKSEGRKMMVYGILGFFFMVSFWAMVKLFVNSFGISIGIPQFNAGETGAFNCTAGQ